MKKWSYLMIFLGLMACKEQPSEKKTESDSRIEQEKPVSVVIERTVGEFPFPVYDFDALEPLLNKKNDTTYIVNFWATWCKPCIQELPYFEKINATYSDKKVKVLLVSLDFPDRIENQLVPFVKKYNIQSEVVVLDDTDANTWIPKVNESWSGAIPATVIYSGATRKFYERSFTYNELENELKTIL